MSLWVTAWAALHTLTSPGAMVVGIVGAHTPTAAEVSLTTTLDSVTSPVFVIVSVKLRT